MGKKKKSGEKELKKIEDTITNHFKKNFNFLKRLYYV